MAHLGYTLLFSAAFDAVFSSSLAKILPEAALALAYRRAREAQPLTDCTCPTHKGLSYMLVVYGHGN